MSLVKHAIQIELKEAIQNSLTYVQQRDSAKTDFKREYFTKKLVENNLLVFDLSEALKRLPDEVKEKEQNGEPVVSESKPSP